MKKIILWLIKHTVPKEDLQLFIKWLELRLGLITKEQLEMWMAIKAEETK